MNQTSLNVLIILTVIILVVTYYYPKDVPTPKEKLYASSGFVVIETGVIDNDLMSCDLTSYNSGGSVFTGVVCEQKNTQ